MYRQESRGPSGSGTRAYRPRLAPERFLHEERDIDPLIRMAAGHYQFEAIPPFTDGNGRTGRVLNSLCLIEEGLPTMPILYFSKHIIANRAGYYDRLIAVTREEAWEPWLLYMLEAVRAELPKIYSRELVDVIFEQPCCRIENLVATGIAKRQTASRYLQLLAGLGVLDVRKVGREVLYLNQALMVVLADGR